MIYSKRLWLILLLVFTGAMFREANSQQRRFNIEVAAGPSFPVGKFGGNTYTYRSESDPDGLAKNGYSVRIIPSYALNKRTNIFISIGAANYKQDESAFKGVDADVGEWNVLQLLTGISYALWQPGQSRFRFNADLAAGICKATTPAFTLKFLTPGYMPPIPPFVIEEESLDISFAYEIGVSGLYKLNDLLGIVGRLDFFGSTAKGEYYGKRNCHLNSINLTFGLNVNF